MSEIGEGQFLEIEKRVAAFKHVFNKLHTTIGIPNGEVGPGAELFETAHQIYLGELINGEIKFSATGLATDAEKLAAIQPKHTTAWVPTTEYSDPHVNLLMGDPTIQDPANPANHSGNGTNPNVEQIIVPLFKAGPTNRQAYFATQPTENALGSEDLTGDPQYELVGGGFGDPLVGDSALDASGDTQSYRWILNQNNLVQNASRRIRNWIAPSKFGVDYTIEIYQSNETFTAPDYNAGPTALAQNIPGIVHGGYLFDYYQGMLYLAPNPEQNDPVGQQLPHIPGLRHPLWIRGYRYIGPTGSNMTVTGAETSNTSGTSTSGGGGVSTTLISQQPGHPLAYDTNTTGWYDSNTLTATDSEDIIEYVTPDNNVIISASFGEQDLIVRLDSSSYNNITSTTAPYYSNEDAAVYNGGNIFAFANETAPDYSSYANFRTTGSAGYHPSWHTQSFEFTTPIRLARVGLCYSNDNAVGVDLSVPDVALSYAFPDTYKLEASSDNITFTQIATATSIRSKTIDGTILGTVDNPTGNIFGDSNNSEYFPDLDESVTTGDKKIYCATASINDTNRYQYYRLYVSGGLATGTTENPESVLTLHHFDLWQNLDFGPTNRKQLNVRFNDRPTGQVGIKGDTLTIFDLAISASAAKLGLVSASAAGLTFFKGGEINQTLTAVLDSENPLPIHLQGFSQVTASIISASNSITTGQLNAVSMSGNGDAITFNSATIAGTTTIQDLIVQNDFQVNADVVIPSDKRIFLTDKKQDGSDGTDEFSARIFGNYVEGGGVSDMYLDAYRIYTISDAKMHMRTLHPSLGSIVLQTKKTHISASSLLVDGAITASSGMSLSGSLLISGSIIPNVGPGTITSSFDLGSETHAWHDIHLSNGTIRLYDGAQEKATIALNKDDQIEFKSGNEFKEIKTGKVTILPDGATISTIQISNDASNGAGFIAVHDRFGKNSTIFRGEGTNPIGDRMGSITQKGTGSFAILLDADHSVDPRDNAKFVVESNSTLPGAFNSQRLFSVSESFETRIHEGGLRADKYVTTTNITASGNIIATGTIIGSNLSGTNTGDQDLSSYSTIIQLNASSHSLQHRISNIESQTSGKLLLSGSAQISSAISGAFTTPSESISGRITVLETFRSANTADIEAGVLEYQTPFSSSIVSRVRVLESNGVFTANAISGAFGQTSGSIQSRLTTVSSNLQSVINVTGSYVITGSNASLNQITASNISASNIIVANIVSASNLHTNIFNPAIISTTEFTASLVNLGDLSNTRTFTTDDYNILFAASTRPTLTVRNAGGGDITYFGSPVDNADAFIKFQADRSSTTFAMGIDSHDGTFKIAEGTYLNENSGFAPFSIKNNKVAILQSNDPAYPLDVAGDIRSTGIMRVDTIKGQTYPYTSIILESNVTTSLSISSSGTITANAFVGDGTGLTGIATAGSVVFNSATASFLTESPFTSAMISGSFTAVSNSIESRLTAAEDSSVTLPANLISSSAQIATEISGAFSSPFTSAMISGSSKAGLDALQSATASYALAANVVTNSATASFITTTTTIDGGTF